MSRTKCHSETLSKPLQHTNEPIRAAARVERDPPGALRARRDDTLHLRRLNSSLNWDELIGSPAKNPVCNIIRYKRKREYFARNDIKPICGLGLGNVACV